MEPFLRILRELSRKSVRVEIRVLGMRVSRRVENGVRV